MKSPRKILQALYVEESGQDLIEYALIVSLIGLVAVASLSTLGITIRDYVFNNILKPLSGI